MDILQTLPCLFCLTEYCLIILLGMFYTTTSENTEQPGNIEDITIIGGGIAGTYTAYKLRDRNLNIGIYEMSDRIGGRYYTRKLQKIPDINIELGAMRYVPAYHKRLNNLVEELGLPIIDFEQKFGIPSKTLYYLRGRHIPYTKLGKAGFLPYNVKPSERLFWRDLQYKLFKENTNTTNNSEPIYTLATNDGIPLYKQSRLQFMGKITNNEAYHYMKDSAAFRSLFDDAIALFARQDKPIDKPYPDFGLPVVKTIGTGFKSIAETALQRFLQASRRHILHINHRLIKIRTIYGGKIKLTFQRTFTHYGVTYNTNQMKIIYTDKVILCLPKEPLKLIDWKPLQNETFRHGVLDSCFANPASKIYLGYANPWWNRASANFTHFKTDLPIRQVYEWKVSKKTGRAILLASYTDGAGTSLWKRLQGQGKVVGGNNDVTDVTEEVIKQVHMDLASIYGINVSNIPTPIDGAMFVFNSDPFNGAWHTWTPGYKLEELRFFKVKPSCRENVFIASGSYASFEHIGWSEGSLQVSDEVLKVLFEPMDLDMYPCEYF